MGDKKIALRVVGRTGGDGGSLVVTVPLEIARVLGLQKGAKVEVFANYEKRSWRYEVID